MIEIKEKLKINNKLNPKIWLDNNSLKPEVLEQLNLIIDYFTLELNRDNIPIDIIDARIVGSNASFNYNEYSDLDIHIVADFDSLGLNTNILNILYNFFKSKFNDKYNISIHGVGVELYIEDVKNPTISNGVYSILNEEWIKYPEKLEIPEVDISDLFDEWEDKYIEIIEDRNYKNAIQFINNLYILRKNSISNEGEYGVGNQIFKEFRNLGYLDNLKDIINQGIEKELTLESLQEMLNNGVDKSSSYGGGAAFIDLEGNFYTKNKGDTTHKEIAWDIYDEHKLKGVAPEYTENDEKEYYGDKGAWYLDYLDDLGWVRVNSGTKYEDRPYIQLPDSSKFNKRYNQILDFLDYVQNKSNQKEIQIFGPYNEWKSYSFEDYISDEILDKIKTYYSKGLLGESLNHQEVFKKDHTCF